LLIDSRRLDASNLFVPVKENSELNLACVSEGGNPRPTLTWEVLLSPGVDRHAQKVSAEVLELEEIKGEKVRRGRNALNPMSDKWRAVRVWIGNGWPELEWKNHSIAGRPANTLGVANNGGSWLKQRLFRTTD